MQQGLESLEKISGGQATKIFLPFEASGVLSALGGIREILAADGGPSVGAPYLRVAPPAGDGLQFFPA